jgi:hypothetical protein
MREDSKLCAKTAGSACGSGISAGTSTLVERASVNHSQEAHAMPLEMLVPPFSFGLAAHVWANGAAALIHRRQANNHRAARRLMVKRLDFSVGWFDMSSHQTKHTQMTDP